MGCPNCNGYNQIHIELKTKGGTSACILMHSNSMRLLDLFTDVLREVAEVFDDVEKYDAVSEFEAIVEDKEFRCLMEKLNAGS